MSSSEVSRAVDVDVAVVGGGPAGLVLADALRGSGLSVAILESGTRATPAPADLGRAEVDGDPIHGLDLVTTRQRSLGGNGNQWVVKIARRRRGWTLGVRYGTLTDQALSRRSWVPGSGWPIGGDELRRWTDRAHELLAVGPADYDGAASPPPGMPVPPDGVAPRRYRFGPRDRVIVEIRDRLLADPATRVVTDATVTSLHRARPGGPVDRLSVATADGARFEARARAVVLATGAIENARLLLLADEQRGIGNETGNVGRHFMEHPLYSIGDLLPARAGDMGVAAFFDLVPSADGARHDHLVTTERWCEANDATELAICLFPRPPRPVVDTLVELKAGLAPPPDVRGVARSAWGLAPRLPWAAEVALRRRESLLPGFGRGGWSRSGLPPGYTELEVLLQCEQAPLAGSRVTLGEERDRFGSPLPAVTWLLGAQTERSVLALQRQLAAQAESTGFGRYRPRSGDLDGLLPPASIVHHLGTTRMAARADDGVVDADCRVHGCANLFVAGSSVFPASGYVNPTLTIAALSLRLAQHLQRELQPSPVSRRPPRSR